MADPKEYIEIGDFRPGIYSDLMATGNTASSSTQLVTRGYQGSNGAAVVENTFDCRADDSGALVPFWRKNIGNTLFRMPPGLISTPPSTAAYWPGGIPVVYTLDGRQNRMRVESGWMGSPLGATVLYGMYFSPGGTSTYDAFVQGMEVDAGGTRNNLYWTKWTPAIQPATRLIPSGNISFSRGQNIATLATDGAWLYSQVITADFPNPGTALTLYNGTIAANEVAFIGSNLSTNGIAGNTYDETCYFFASQQQAVSIKFTDFLYATGYADFATNRTGMPAVTVTWIAPTNTTLAAMHQGRLVLASWTSRSTSLTTNGGGDRLYYSPVRRPTGFVPATSRSTYLPLVPGETPTSPIGTIGVVTADQLFVAKAKEGAVIISGDLSNPTIRNIPYAEPTGGVIMSGVQTSIGYIYGSPNGIFVWQGGDTTQKLSMQLDGFFWDHTLGTEAQVGGTVFKYTGSRGRFGWWNEHVFVPNNFVLDTTNGGWWKISTTNDTAYNVYDVDDLNHLYCFPWRVTPTQLRMFDTYSTESLASSYSWQSQPLMETRGRRQSFQEIRALVTHRGTTPATMTVTLTGYNQDGSSVTPVATTFTIPVNQNPQLLYKYITPNFLAEYVQVRIQMNSNLSTDQAPKLHNIRFGVSERARSIRTP